MFFPGAIIRSYFRVLLVNRFCHGVAVLPGWRYSLRISKRVLSEYRMGSGFESLGMWRDRIVEVGC